MSLMFKSQVAPKGLSFSPSDFYISDHYAAIAHKSHIFKEEHILERAKENLEIIGKVYGYE